LIFGLNESDPGADSNGSGKSTLIEAITLAISGMTCRDINKEDFIQDGEDECFVQFDLKNKLGDVNDLSIKRWFHRRKSAKIEIWENNSLNKEITSVNEANQRIYELIGLTRDDLLHFFIIGQDTNFSFLTVNDTEKKNIIARLSNTDKINNIIDNLKNQKKEIESSKLRKLEDSVNGFDSKIEVYEEEILSLKNDKSDSNKEKINEIKQEITDLEQESAQLEVDKEAYQLQIDKLNEEDRLITIDGSSLETAEQSLEKLEAKLKKSKTKVRNSESTIDHLETIKDGVITCPKCEHEFNPSSDIDVSEVEELIEFTNEELIDAQESVKKLNKKIKIKEQDISRIKENSNRKKEIKSKVKRLKDKIEGADDEISVNNRSIEKLNNSIEKLSIQNNNKNKIKEIRLKIAEIEKEKEFKSNELESVKEEISIIDYWIYHFGKKGFSTYISNKSVKVIEGMTNSYLRKFNSDLQVQIDGFTALKNGELSEKISVSIVRNGKFLGSFKRYSGGEKGRINLANIVGLQKLMNMSAPTGGLNLLILDEVFDGLDSTGQKDVVNILEGIGVTTLVVSHRNDPLGSTNELYIKKMDGVSKIINN
jgi:exonuclease SbcC